MNRRFLFIINQNMAPIGTRESLEKYFQEHGQYNHIYEPTATIDDVRKQIASHLHEIDGIVAYGGDGTFHHALNAVNELAEHPDRGRRVSLGDLVFGALCGGGTGNDIGKALKMGDTRKEISKGKEPQSLKPIVESSVNDDYIRAFDFGYCELQGQKRRVFFFNIFGVGYDAYVAKRAKELKERYLKSMPGFARFSYFLGALISLFSYRPVGVKSLRINDIPVEVNEKVFMMALMNSQIAGGGLTLNPYGTMDDRALELIILGDFSELISKPGLVGLLVGAFFGKPNIHHPKVRYINNRDWDNEGRMDSQVPLNPEKQAIQKVKVEFEERVFCEADGDIMPDTDGYDANLCPYQLRVITGNKKSCNR
ncbi:MAG: hypothetical protein JSW70_01955 [Syntrophobacterales bacterium]|nr:MAG: hypothetical protein JSW70_01955 [Syntrophobacterales bacterium]